MADHLQPQPHPVPSDKPSVWELVIHDLETAEAALPPGTYPLRPWAERRVVALVREDARARDAQGRERYGVPLQSGNGRDALVDAYQEALDLLVYLRQALEEGVAATLPDDQIYVLEHVGLLYRNALGSVRHLRGLLLARDGR